MPAVTRRTVKIVFVAVAMSALCVGVAKFIFFQPCSAMTRGMSRDCVCAGIKIDTTDITLAAVDAAPYQSNCLGIILEHFPKKTSSVFRQEML